MAKKIKVKNIDKYVTKRDDFVVIKRKKRKKNA